MKLESLTVNVRPMGVYHAMDLGLAMARTWYGQLWYLSFTLVGWLLAFCALVSAWFCVQMDNLVLLPFFMFCAVWLCRTYAEMYLVALLGQKVFDDHANIYSVQSMFGATIKKNYLPMLWRYFSQRRNLMMAVRILEGQTGEHAKHRLSALTRGINGSVFALTLIFGWLEFILFVAGLDFFDTLMSLPYGDEISLLTPLFAGEAPLWLILLIIAWYVVVVLLVLPFFVGANFAVYLCRRSQLEAWDVELSFRKMARRFEILSAQKTMPPSQAAKEH